jgi:hypothetical protein
VAPNFHEFTQESSGDFLTASTVLWRHGCDNPTERLVLGREKTTINGGRPKND